MIVINISKKLYISKYLSYLFKASLLYETQRNTYTQCVRGNCLSQGHVHYMYADNHIIICVYIILFYVLILMRC